MRKIETIAIIGAGAMGAAYASMFAEAASFSVSFVAQGERYHSLKGAELLVNDKAYRIPVKRPEDFSEAADLVLVALKHHHLQEALPAIKAVSGAHSVVLSVMNGLDSEGIIGAFCGRDDMVLAIAVGIDAVREGQRFSYARPGRIIFGHGPQGGDAGLLDRLSEALERAGIPHERPADMVRVMWWKFMINVGINQASAVLRAPYGVFQQSTDARELMVLLMDEVIELAGSKGIDLTRKDLDDWLTVLATLGPAGKTSMLQDIEAGRKTEVDIFAGRVVGLGRELGIATPVNQIFLHLLRVMEQKSMGKEEE